MLRKHVAPFAALIALGALALSACGVDGSAQPAPQAQPVDQRVQQESAGSDPAGVSFLAGTARSNKADPNTGDLAPKSAPREVKDKWVQLRATSAGALNPVVVNGAGMTLYRFDKDTANPSESTCDGECAQTWPPVTIAKGGKVFIAGIAKRDVGFVKRADGRTQLTVGGWPVYLFSKDVKPGDTLGQGVGGTWFGVTPNGGKAGTPVATTTPPAPAGPAVPPATSATLFSGKNFDDFSGTNFATGVTGPGCQDVRGDFLSIAPGGSVKLWSEPGCTGKSAVITDDVRDVTALGFPTGPKSLFFG